MRGQAQGLYGLMTINVAGILGSLLFEVVYRCTVATPYENWTIFWAAMAFFATIPLIYFLLGGVKKNG